ncbi:Uncharacterised protein [Streptococcus pneumoniae]|nr:Uncharacterised protein [Streptococcus pneumoniae]
MFLLVASPGIGKTFETAPVLMTIVSAVSSFFSSPAWISMTLFERK